MLHYRAELNKVLDRVISDIGDITSYLQEVIAPITILHPKNISTCTKADVKTLCSNFSMDLNDSDALFSEILRVGKSIEECDADTIQEAAKFLLDKRCFYPILVKAFQIALTIHVSVASNERSFSKLKIVKTYLRSTMEEDRLDALMVSACSSDILDRIDLDRIADAWSLLKTRKISI